MAKASPKLQVKKPVNFFLKPLSIDFKGLFKALAKGIGHGVVGKWEEIGSDAVETLSAIGLVTEPGELGFLLIRRSMISALFSLVGESAGQLLAESKAERQINEEDLVDRLDFSVSPDIVVDSSFLDRPATIPLVEDAQAVLRIWLREHELPDATVDAIASRLPSYFVYALNQEWRRNAKSYGPILEALQTPFTKAGEREWSWSAYSALLKRRVQEGVFDEPFSLGQIFVPLNAYYLENPGGHDRTDDIARTGRQGRRVVVSLQHELERWLREANREDAIRVISGGPGSGKSSFARIFAARVADQNKLKVLFVPLHLIDPSRDFVGEVGRFVQYEGVLVQNPLDPESPEPNLLIILDGLDELASQGKAAAEAARAFIGEVDKVANRSNLQTLKLRILISGRELVVQENESEFRRTRQVLTLLPYFVPDRDRVDGSEQIADPDKLLNQDLRQEWWRRYGTLTGTGYAGLPAELNRPDLEEITGQPLLNFLVALSFARGKLDFTKGVGLNAIYSDLVTAVYDRGYEKHRPYEPIRHMTCAEFFRVLEEIGLAAWHGDGRTTSVSEIEAHCQASGVGKLLDAFRQGAESGVTRLLAAFFFRQYGRRSSGDPTFVFTHKSFGEYLAARRIARAIEKAAKELSARQEDPDEGWDEREALKRWAEVCGPSALSPYIRVFLSNEMWLRGFALLGFFQDRLAKLFTYVLRYGMPMEQLPIPLFRDALFQARNAEETLLAALSACSRVTQRVSEIEQQYSTDFGEWFKRIQGQRMGPESVLAASCLSYLGVSRSFLDLADFWGADFSHSDLSNIQGHYILLGGAELRGVNLSGATLSDAVLTQADLEGSDLTDAHLDGASLERAHLSRANLRRARFRSSNLKGADLRGADLRGADFRGADLRGADLAEANLRGAKFQGARVKSALIDGAKMEQGGDFKGALIDDTPISSDLEDPEVRVRARALRRLPKHGSSR